MAAQQEPHPWQQHIQVGVRGSGRVNLPLTTIPFAYEEHGEASGINNQKWIGASRRGGDFLETTQRNKASLLSSFRAHRHLLLCLRSPSSRRILTYQYGSVDAYRTNMLHRCWL